MTETDSDVAEVLEGLDESTRTALSRGLRDRQSSCIALRCRSAIAQEAGEGGKNSSVDHLPSAVTTPACGSSKLGGWPYLPAGYSWPVDKKGTHMAFIGQINFAEMPNIPDSCPDRGILLLFKSIDHRDYLPKDRAGFKVMWFENLEGTAFSYPAPNVPSVPLLPELLLESSVAWSLPEPTSYGKLLRVDLSPEQEMLLVNWVRLHNERELGKHQLLGVNHPRLEEAKAVCAFAANGVSHSPQRHNDPMFKHLVDASQDWQLLWRITEDSTSGQAKGATELFVMIRSQDLNARNLQNAWMVGFPERR